MTRNLSVWNSLRPFSVGFDSMFEEFDRMLESTERYNSNYPPYNIHKLSETDYKIEIALAGYSKDDIELELKENTLTVRNKAKEKVINVNGFVFCGPEYNGGSAPILTNAITWISVKTDYSREAFSNKIGLIATHSGGNGSNFLSTFRQQLEFMGVVVFPRTIKVNKSKEFNAETSKKIIDRFENLL